MRRFYCFIILGLGWVSGLIAQDYHYQIDLNKVVDDQVWVELRPPVFDQEKVAFHFPRIVPGTYAIYNFGQYIHDFEAYDESGTRLKVSHPDPQTWVISDARKLARLRYLVEDTWDATRVQEPVFEPAGSNISEGHFFLVNPYCFAGFFEGKETGSFRLSLDFPDSMVAVTTFPDYGSDHRPGHAVFQTDSYTSLADYPIVVCKPDTGSLVLGGTKITVVIASEDQVLKPSYLLGILAEVLIGVQDYLGGTLPVKEYAFLICLYPGFAPSGSYGAMEHNTSSVYSFFRFMWDQVPSQVKDLAAHEFFHILTPLTVHSEQIHAFNFIKPEMSRHLWLYEGVTEYFAGHMKVWSQLIALPEYLSEIRGKINAAAEFRDHLPFTEMSLHVLDRYADQYMNVYQKGPLIGLCLDLLLRKLSGGKKGLLDLMRELGERYGKERPFPDARFFEVLESMTYPEVGTFLRRHVGGKVALPLDTLLAEAGIVYQGEGKAMRYSLLGGVDLNGREDRKIEVASVRELNAFGKALGFRKGDLILAFNDREVDMDNFETEISGFATFMQEGKMVKFLVGRKAGKRMRKVLLKSPLFKVEQDTGMELYALPDDQLSPEQIRFRKAWLGKYYRK